MNTIVVYYSMEGNTDLAAGRIAAALGADLLRLYPCKAYPDRGFRKVFLKENDLTGRRVAAFACQSGSGAEKAFAKLQACLPGGLEATLVLTDPKAKPDEKNEEKIRAFCAALDGTPA